jgi:hypothetical protein
VSVRKSVERVLEYIDQLHRKHFLSCLLIFSMSLAVLWNLLEGCLAEGNQKRLVSFGFLGNLVGYSLWFSKYHDRKEPAKKKEEQEDDKEIGS